MFRLRDKVKSKFLKFVRLEILCNFSANEQASPYESATYLNQVMLFDENYGSQKPERRTEADGFFTLRSYDEMSNNGPIFKSESTTLQNWRGAKVVSARNCKSDSSSLGSPSPINATANQYISVDEDQTTQMLSEHPQYQV